MPLADDRGSARSNRPEPRGRHCRVSPDIGIIVPLYTLVVRMIIICTFAESKWNSQKGRQPLRLNSRFEPQPSNHRSAVVFYIRPARTKKEQPYLIALYCLSIILSYFFPERFALKAFMSIIGRGYFEKLVPAVFTTRMPLIVPTATLKK